MREHRGSTRGKYALGGTHRASLVRKEGGGALTKQNSLHETYPEWYEGTSSPPELRTTEQPLEERVSSYSRDLPLLWVDVDDAPGPDSDRAFLERQITALDSTFEGQPIDPRDDGWLGHQNPNETIRRAGLWELDNATETYTPAVIDRFDHYVSSAHRQ